MEHQTQPLVIAIGVFDGVHRGHQAILREARRHASRTRGTAAVLTFDPHPSRVVRPAEAVPLIQTLAGRYDWIRRFGVNRIITLKFSPRLSKLTSSEFVNRALFRQGNISGVVVGRGFRFGHRRAGGVRELRNLLASRGARLWVVPPVRSGGGTVCSTAIRRFLAQGRVDAARKMLGHPVELTGTLKRGSGTGRRLGSPTINLVISNEMLPRCGVYAGWIIPADPQRRGARRPVVMNIGHAPTVCPDREILLEAHVLDGRPVAYRPGRRFNVEIIDFFRPERTFSSTAALQRAIRGDVGRARRIFNRPGRTPGGTN